MNKVTDTREHLLFAKQGFTEAAQAAMTGDPGAAEQAPPALAELNTARTELNRQHDASSAIGIWAESARLASTQPCTVAKCD